LVRQQTEYLKRALPENTRVAHRFDGVMRNGTVRWHAPEGFVAVAGDLPGTDTVLHWSHLFPVETEQTPEKP